MAIEKKTRLWKQVGAFGNFNLFDMRIQIKIKERFEIKFFLSETGFQIMTPFKKEFILQLLYTPFFVTAILFPIDKYRKADPVN